MGDIARVLTRFESPEALMEVVGASLTNGSLRLPIHIRIDHAFDIVLETNLGNEAVRGSAEVVEHDGDATWVRFLCAVNIPGTEASRVVLDDVAVILEGDTIEKSVLAPSLADKFEEVITSVNDRPAALDGLPSGAAEPVAITAAEPIPMPPLLPPPPEPAPEPIVTAPATVNEAVQHAIEAANDATSPVLEAQVESERATVLDTPAVEVATERDTPPQSIEVAAETNEASVDAVAAPAEIAAHVDPAAATVEMAAESLQVGELADRATKTAETEPIALTDQAPPVEAATPQKSDKDDAVASERGIPPIGEPYARAAKHRRSRTMLFAAIGASSALMVVTISVIVWARGEVDRARVQSAAKVVEPTVVATADPDPTNDVTDAVEPPIVMPIKTGTCKVAVEANVKNATVWVDGVSRGRAPSTIETPCQKQIDVEVRHPRYDDFKRKLIPDGDVEIEARLERENTAVTLWSQPEGATVTLNGVVLCKTPCVAKVNRYEQHTLWFRAPGMDPDWRRIVPKQGKKTVSIALRPNGK